MSGLGFGNMGLGFPKMRDAFLGGGPQNKDNSMLGLSVGVSLLVETTVCHFL